MILTKKELQNLMTSGALAFTPELDEYQLQPNSIDLRVGWSFYIPDTWKFDERGRTAVIADYLNYQNVEEYFKLIKLKPGQFFEILPKETIIISTLEKITLNSGRLAGNLFPRSSALRRGLQINTGVVDCRYSGQLTIPVVNNSNHIIKIYPGERICQLQLFELASELTVEEAKAHGKQSAKYEGSTPYGLEAKVDANEEVDLIKAGKIDELKTQFKLKL
ncbi:MAG: Deoxycytidine triphosphate deaminase [Parcubacteria group bacterium GW2011_GWC2_39_14]|nr:MAG: Deoxycytidine triphosphate deaminase [Parcubacteria group bacterium GW2011_GWC2_39_14]KKR55111.1 MAG: Deoxycytidine triphosphate deaminase [Parcubacteria group bacterium GW2011_GWA2_40_23]